MNQYGLKYLCQRRIAFRFPVSAAKSYRTAGDENTRPAGTVFVTNRYYLLVVQHFLIFITEHLLVGLAEFLPFGVLLLGQEGLHVLIPVLL